MAGKTTLLTVNELFRLQQTKKPPYGSFFCFGYSKYTDSRIALEEMESVREDLYNILSEKSGNDFDKIVELCEHGDKWMKPEQAIELGFIDDIIVKKS